jgi:hypothetical protein
MAKRYHTPRNHAERLAEAEQSIARITATMNTGDNRYGSYGDNCRNSIARWQITADHARGQIALGEVG